MPKPDWIQLIYQRRQAEPVELPTDAAPRLQTLQDIRAVVFDVYGTLFSSGVGDISLATEDNRDTALRNTLIANGIHISDTAQGFRFDEALHDVIHRHQAARRTEGVNYPEVEIRRVWKDFIGALNDSEYIRTPQEIEIETLVIDYESRVNPTQPMPELRSTLQALKARGQMMSIISNAQFYTPLLFETYLQSDTETLGFCSECNVWSYQLLEGKPSTRLYEVAAEKLQQHHGISPEQVLYVGNDLRNDIWPAQAIGFKTALFAGDCLSLRRRKDDSDCKHIVADLEITELTQILDCI